MKVTKTVVVKLLYQMMYDIHRIACDNDIKYWTYGGTTLGAVRNRGLIPWDDVLDIGTMQLDLKKFLGLEVHLQRCGYSIVKTWFGYKVCLSQRSNIPECEWSYPFLDIFPFTTHTNKLVLARKQARALWPNAWYNISDTETLELFPFGDFHVFVPANADAYCDRMYGEDWRTHGYRVYDHEKEMHVKVQKVRLREQDKQPAEPTRVIRRRCVGGF